MDRPAPATIGTNLAAACHLDAPTAEMLLVGDNICFSRRLGRHLVARPESFPPSAALDRDKGHNFSRSSHAGQYH